MYNQLINDNIDFVFIYYMSMGMMLITVVFMLIHYLIMKQVYFLFYGLCLLCLFLNYFLKTPFFHAIYSDWHFHFYLYFNQNSLLFGNFFYMLFIRSFTNMKGNYPKIYPLFNILAVFFSMFIIAYNCFIFINPLNEYHEVVFQSFLIIISLTALGFMIVMIIRKQLTYTTVVLIGAIFLLVGQILTTVLGKFFIMVPVIIIETIVFTGVITFLDFKSFKKVLEIDQLKQINKFKNKFLANISHEFRTPLTLIASPIDDVLADNATSDNKRQQFTVAKQNSDRLLELVNQLLDLSKIDAGHLKLHVQQGNVLQLIAALSGSFSYHAKQKDISYSINIEQSEETTWFDKDAIEKITVNLLSNALKYTPKKGTVTCLAYVENSKLFLEVKNTGKGLTKHESENIFERFYQTNEQNQGTGIGLALVRELVELHKGEIQVTSAPSKETSFKLSLSIDINSFKKESIITTSINEVEKEIPLYTNVSINDGEEFTDSDLPILLVVEDNDDLRHLLKQTFEDRYNVIFAPNGIIGVELALECIPDLIISDVMMPEKDGFTLTKELKNDERSAHIPIILLTAKAEAESHFEGINTGADDYITKPFDKKLLALKVEKLIDSRRQLQVRYSQELVLIPKDIAITNLDEKFLKKVQAVLDKNLVESSFSIKDFSEAVGMSRMQLHRKLKALTGLTATEFIRSQRLKLAANLLKTSDINISQVGYSVGFNDHSYFAKCFKEAYNCTPTEFTKRN